jgi:cytochrome c oxidase subunit 2
MRGVYGSRVQLTGGQTILADDAYIRESILNPNAKIVAGYRPDIMPTFQGQITEEQLLQLIVYVKSLAITNTPTAPPTGAAGQPIGAVTPAPRRILSASIKP